VSARARVRACVQGMHASTRSARKNRALARQVQGLYLSSTKARTAGDRRWCAARWATRRRVLGCLRWCARFLTRMRVGLCTRSAKKAESHPSGRVHTGCSGRAEGFDPSGVCVRICADVGGVATAATRTDGACTATTQRRAQRADLGEAVFRVEVDKKVRTWGRWLDGHTCAGALGFAAMARRNVEHGHRQVKQGPGPSVVCVRVRAEQRRRGHGGDTKLMACTRQGKKERGMARNGPAVLVRHKCR
jgi:hypothetical protein